MTHNTSWICTAAVAAVMECMKRSRGVADTRGHLAPFGVNGDPMTKAVMGVGRQRFAVALFTRRALAHVQQTGPAQ